MALVLLQSGMDPLGQFEGLDALLTTVKGGEVLTFGAVTLGTNAGAADALDGYQAGGTKQVVVTTSITSSATKPLMLCDDGMLHYGTLFGSVVGGEVGQQSYGLLNTPAVQLGPATALASGKLTCWDKPGLYGVTLDACDTTVGTGLQPSNSSLTSGNTLYANIHGAGTGDGIITPTAGSNAVIGYFVEFRSNGSLVTTPNRLVSALNSPSSVVGGQLPQSLYMAVFHFNP